MRMLGIIASILVLTSPAQVTIADIVVDQPHDFVAFSPSEEDTAVPFARTADDFVVRNDGIFVLTIGVDLIVTFPNQPADYALEVYAGETPSQDPVFVFSEIDGVLDRGAWNGDPNLHLMTITFNIYGTFLHGHYWVSPYGIGNGSGTDRAWWGTAGNGEVNDSEGYFKSEHFGVPEWTPISQSGILDYPTDFAMTIEAIVPAPGAFCMLGLAPCARRARRRG